MDNVRYFAALVLLMLAPGALLYWLSVHPFIGFWRRVGVRATLYLHFAFVIAMALVAYRFRAFLLSVEYGSSIPLALLGGALLAAGIVYGGMIKRRLKTRILIGIPEIAPEEHGISLMTEGVYSVVRHPRYLQLILLFLGWAFFTNYLAAYIMLGVSVALLLLIVPLEERELRERFGRAYDEYSARTPRLIPRLRRN